MFVLSDPPWFVASQKSIHDSLWKQEKEKVGEDQECLSNPEASLSFCIMRICGFVSWYGSYGPPKGRGLAGKLN